ncbi:hypothetical protein [Methylobacterium sp. A54F]
MRRLYLLAALLLTAAAGACAPNPIIARDPVAAPGPDIGYTCNTRPTVLNGMLVDCDPVARQPQTVLRAKG